MASIKLSDLPKHLRDQISTGHPAASNRRKLQRAALQEESELEAIFAYQLRCQPTIPKPVREHVFHPTRKWRFDFAWPARLIAVEIEGAIHVEGRHTRGVTFQDDCEKYSEAALLGWLVLRATDAHLDNLTALRWLQTALNRPVAS
jgi:very-short-patch-repair endonuclease